MMCHHVAMYVCAHAFVRPRVRVGKCNLSILFWITLTHYIHSTDITIYLPLFFPSGTISICSYVQLTWRDRERLAHTLNQSH